MPGQESRIKSLTGGNRISARVMRGDPFEFSPVFKLWIAGNHKPTLRNPDPAMRRRLHLTPLTFVPAKPDLGLVEALREELPAILTLGNPRVPGVAAGEAGAARDHCRNGRLLRGAGLAQSLAGEPMQAGPVVDGDEPITVHGLERLDDSKQRGCWH